MREQPKQKRGWVTYVDPVHIAIVRAGAIEADFVLTKQQEGGQVMSDEKKELKELSLEEFETEFEKAEGGAIGIVKDLVAEALKVEGLPDKAKGLLKKIQSGLGKLKGYGYPKKDIEETVKATVQKALEEHDASEMQKAKAEHQKEVTEILEKVKEDFVPKDQVKKAVQEALKDVA